MTPNGSAIGLATRARPGAQPVQHDAPVIGQLDGGGIDDRCNALRRHASGIAALEYQAALPHRLKSADYQAILFEAPDAPLGDGWARYRDHS